MITVRAYFDDGIKEKHFKTMIEAMAFQELLIFTYGVDAEII